MEVIYSFVLKHLKYPVVDSLIILQVYSKKKKCFFHNFDGVFYNLIQSHSTPWRIDSFYKGVTVKTLKFIQKKTHIELLYLSQY